MKINNISIKGFLKFKKKYKTQIYLLLIIFAAFYFRTFNIDWDNSYYFHPDERAIVMFASPLKLPASLQDFLSVGSPLNPHFFAYGNFPLYLLKITGTFASTINPTFDEYGGMHIVGRLISAIADTLTVILVFIIASTLFAKRVGLFSSLIYALSVFPIQASHFFAVDSLLALFITLTIYLSIIYSKRASLKSSFFLGLTFGLALATKVSAAIIGITIFIVILDKIYTEKGRRLNILFHAFVISAVTSIIFIFTQPYSLIDHQSFITQVRLQSQMSKDPFIFPYTLQYVGKIPYLYELKNISLWGQGPVIFSLVILGFLFLLVKFIKKQKVYTFPVFVIIFTSISYFLIFGKFAVGWMRYMLPLYPMLSIFGGFFVSEFLIAKLPTNFLSNYLLRKITLLIFLLLLVLYPISFLSIYSKPNTRLQATEWINTNIPAGKSLAIEHWDDALPVTGGEKYTQLTLPLYDPDTEAKWNEISNVLEYADYIIIASNRLYAPLQRLTNCHKLPKNRCYVKTNLYYKALFAEGLNFKKVAEFTSYPTIPLVNIKLIDDSADESFTVYDHPKILIFKKD